MRAVYSVASPRVAKRNATISRYDYDQLEHTYITQLYVQTATLIPAKTALALLFNSSTGW